MFEPLRSGDPSEIDGYVLEGRLGEGSMGVVYKGWNLAGKPVAIKTIAPKYLADKKYRARFAREAEAASRVPRFCTAKVEAFSPGGELPYIVTEYVSDETLADLIDSHELLLDSQVEAIAVGTATALQAIHEAKIIHRDLKPSNILISVYGPRVIDFGLATLVDCRNRLTSSGEAVGTLAYMAPEQARGEEIFASADIYSWAATIVCAATSRPPKLSNPLTREYLGVSSALFPLVRAALAEKAEDRPSTEEIFAALVGLSPRIVGKATNSATDLGPSRSVSPRTATQWAKKSQESLKEGRAELALFAADQGIKLDPESALCHFYRGLSLLELKDRTAGERELRLSAEMDPSNNELVAGVTRTLGGSPDPSSKALALRMSLADETTRDLYVSQLVAAGTEGVIKAFEVDPDHPRVIRAYGELLMQNIVTAEKDLRKAQREVEELRVMLARYHSKEGSYWQQAQEASDAALEANERARLASQELGEAIKKAYLIAPTYSPIRAKYALSLVDGGQPSDLIPAFKLGRGSGPFLRRFMTRALWGLEESQVRLLLVELSTASPREFELFVSSFVEGVRSSHTSADEWRHATARMMRRAQMIEDIGGYCLERLSDGEEGLATRLNGAIAMAYVASSDKEARSLAWSFASVIAIPTALLWLLTAPLQASIPPWIPASALAIAASIVLLTSLRTRRGAALRRNMRASRSIPPRDLTNLQETKETRVELVKRSEAATARSSPAAQEPPLVIEMPDDC